MASLDIAIAVGLDDDVVARSPLGGGDVAESYRVELASGRVVFAKTHRRPPPFVFSTEAAGLMWLGEPDVIPVPEVLLVHDGTNPNDTDSRDTDGRGNGAHPPLLVLGWIPPGRPTATTEVELGRALAAMHRAGAPSFGRSDGRTTGSRRLPNDPCDGWTEFFATRRLEPLRRLAADDGALPERALRKLDAVIDRLDTLGVPDEPPARLHGDLWAGNRVVDHTGTSWLIDPACFGGHREFDLAMMLLFGGFGADVFAAYDDAFPIADGWRGRVPLHQLAPLVVHAIKFGGGYAAASERALDAVLTL